LSTTISRGKDCVVFKTVEKSNHNAVHAYCVSLESAQRWISSVAPDYCRRRVFANKTLTPESFEAVQES
jgi:hypothetical protein